ncbi:NAD(P)H-binding protein [bacterium]|nr:NAD(P)H-binding protein [bacterium]
MRTALLVGASGLIGKSCLDALLRDELYSKVIAFVRKPLPLQHPKLQQQIVDFDNLEYHAHLIKAADVFCCLGTTIRIAGSKGAFYKVDFTYPYNIAIIAAHNGVGQFLIVTSLGASAQSKVFYNRVKGTVEDAVAGLKFKGVHIFRPSLLLGERNEFRPGEKIAMFLFRIFGFILIGRWKKYRAIRASVVAEAMVTMAKLDLQGIRKYESDVIQVIYDEQIKTKRKT